MVPTFWLRKSWLLLSKSVENERGLVTLADFGLAKRRLRGAAAFSVGQTGVHWEHLEDAILQLLGIHSGPCPLLVQDNELPLYE